MANIYRLENNDLSIGGIAIDFGNNVCRAVSWTSAQPVDNPLELAKDCAARVLDGLMREGLVSVADGTNWPSVVAAFQRHISDWNDKLRGQWRAAVETIPPVDHTDRLRH